MEFFRQEYWNGQSFPSLRDFPNPGIKPEAYLTGKMSISHTCEYLYKTFHFTVSWEN